MREDCKALQKTKTRWLGASAIVKIKGGQIKYDVARFIKVYKQYMDFLKKRTGTVDIVRRAYELFKQRSKNGTTYFQYEYYLVLMWNHPRWATRLSPPKAPAIKRKALLRESESNYIDLGNIEGEGGTIQKGRDHKHNQSDTRHRVSKFGWKRQRWQKKTLQLLRCKRKLFMPKSTLQNNGRGANEEDCSFRRPKFIDGNDDV